MPDYQCYSQPFTARTALASGAWSHVADMAVACREPAAAAGLDGRIFVIGGVIGGTTPTNSVEAYDQRANTWTPVAPMSEPRGNHGAATGPDGKIYVAGGSRDQGDLFVRDGVMRTLSRMTSMHVAHSLEVSGERPARWYTAAR